MNMLFLNDYLTIDIGFKYIKVVQVRLKKNDDLMIVNYGIGITPKGCIKNGAIKDKTLVREEIFRVIKENNLFAKSSKVVISGTNIITRIIMVEKVPDDRLDERIRDEIHLCLPIDLDEHRVDFKVLGTVWNGEKEEVKVFVTAVAKKIINSYIDILNELNLKPLSVDIPANSVSKFFKKNINCKDSDFWARKIKTSKLRNSNTIAVIDLGSETTIVNVLKDKIPEFNRVVLMGSSNIDTAIFNELNLEKKLEERAENYKKTYGIVDTRDINNEVEWRCSNAAKEVMNEILKNIKTCFEFYISRCAGEEISRIYLIGGGAQLKGLKEYFEENLNAPTYAIDQSCIEGIIFAPKLDTGKVNYLVNALGAAL
jgi:type IV pilus assembly protein PilM